jgi:predicted N-acetyltransferase YhbS
MFLIRAEAAGDAAQIEPLLDRCFGVDRHQKTSYRYRRGVAPLTDLAFVAEDDTGTLVGAIRYWPIRLGPLPALLLGPLAIDPDRQGRGIGRALVFHSLESATAAGHRLVFLVGDPAYYARFGFTVAPSGIVMPGEQASRLNYRVLDPAWRLPRSGTLAAATAARSTGNAAAADSRAHPEVADSGKAIATAPATH